jgi:membrane-bound serine protease (ClpP class)
MQASSHSSLAPAPHSGADFRIRCPLSLCAAITFSLTLLLGPIFSLAARAQTEMVRPILAMDIKGAIGFVTASELAKAIERAQELRAEVLLVRLDTPGGLVSSTRDMTQAMLGSSVPIVVYVAPSGARAASAGTYLLYASHLAAMAPGTHLGAATPIPLGPGLPGAPPSQPSPGQKKGDSEPADAASRKSLNDAIAYIRTLAQLRGRNAEWAEKAVKDAATLTATEALKENVIEVIASSTGDLLAKIDGRTLTTASGEVKLATRDHPVIEIKPDWKTQFLSVIADPNIAFILLLVGIYGILFEFWSPGAIAPGVIGGISLIVALTALSVLPVNLAGLALLLLGIGFMVAEAFTPGFGLLGGGGLVAFVMGALFLFEPIEPNVPVAVSRPLIAGAAIVSGAFLIGILGVALSARRRPVQTGADRMIGQEAEVLTWSGDGGQVKIQGEIWEAKSDRPLLPREKVRILNRSGLTLLVQALGGKKI